MTANDPRSEWRILAIVGLLTYALAYAPIRHAGFIWDDPDYIVNNTTLRHAAGLWQMWFEPGALPQYYPLVHTTFWIEHQLYGTDPLGYHVVNWLLHGANAALVYLLLRRFSGRVATLAALIFLLHPVHVESVAWATERKNVLSGLFYLGAWLVWFRFEEKRSTASWLALFGLYLGALLSKSVTASLPAAILLLGFWRDGRIQRRDVLSLAPLFITGIAFGLHTAYIEMFDLGGTGQGASGAEWALSFAERLLVAGRAFFFYPWKVLWPHPLAFFYPRWTLDTSSLMQWLWPIAAVALLIALWALRRRIGRTPLAATLFYAGTVLPAIGFLNVYPFRYSFAADHFQYLASLGTITLIAAGLARISGRLPVLWIALLLAIPLGILTHRHARVFRDVESLWHDTIAKNDTCWAAHNNLAGHYREIGRTELARHHYETALRIKPDHHDAKLSLGLLAIAAKDHARAETLFREVTRDAPDFGPAFGMLGLLHAVQNRLRSAERSWRKAIELTPEDAPSRANLVKILRRRGDLKGALALLEEGIRISPRAAGFHTAAAQCLMGLDRRDEARRAARRALSIDPDQSAAQQVLDLIENP